MNRYDRLSEIVEVIDHDHLTERENAYRLARRLERQERRLRGVAVPLLAYVALTVRCYGGPEEGGWWYDSTEVAEVVQCADWRAARIEIRRLREEYPQPRHDRFSVLGTYDVGVYVTSHEDFLPQPEPRPRYE